MGLNIFAKDELAMAVIVEVFLMKDHPWTVVFRHAMPVGEEIQFLP